MTVRPCYADEAVPDGYQVHAGVEAMPESVWHEIKDDLTAEITRQMNGFSRRSTRPQHFAGGNFARIHHPDTFLFADRLLPCRDLS